MNLRRRGFMLILAVVLMGAIGVTLMLVTRHFVGLTRSSRFAMLDVRAAQLVASGREWAAAHTDDCAALTPGESIALPVTQLVPPSMHAVLRITRAQAGRNLVVTATVRHGRQAATFRTACWPRRTETPSATKGDATHRVDPARLDVRAQGSIGTNPRSSS